MNSVKMTCDVVGAFCGRSGSMVFVSYSEVPRAPSEG